MKFWAARDKAGHLFIFPSKPIWEFRVWLCQTGGGWMMPEGLNKNTWFSDFFTEVTFENSPQQFKLISSEEYKRLKEIEEVYNEEGEYKDKHYC